MSTLTFSILIWFLLITEIDSESLFKLNVIMNGIFDLMNQTWVGPGLKHPAQGAQKGVLFLKYYTKIETNIFK